MGLNPAWAIHLRGGLNDLYWSLPTQNILQFCEKIHETSGVFLFNDVKHWLKKYFCWEHLVEVLTWWLRFTLVASLHVPGSLTASHHHESFVDSLIFLVYENIACFCSSYNHCRTTLKPQLDFCASQHVHGITSDYKKTNYRVSQIKQQKINLIWKLKTLFFFSFGATYILYTVKQSYPKQRTKT